MKFNINDYKGNYVMHCKTEAEAKDFCRYLNSVGRKWCGDKSYLEKTCYHDYCSDTVYYFNVGTYGSKKHIKENYTILEWSDFMNNRFTKADLKTGDVVMQRDGLIQIAICELNMFITPNGWNDMDAFDTDLTHEYTEEYDIIAVRRPKEKFECQFNAFNTKYGILVYERKEVEEMTLDEVCKLLGKEIKIIK